MRRCAAIRNQGSVVLGPSKSRMSVSGLRVQGLHYCLIDSLSVDRRIFVESRKGQRQRSVGAAPSQALCGYAIHPQREREPASVSRADTA
jgi:hypothetical protein